MSLEVQIRKSYKDFNLAVAFQTGGTPLALLGASGSGKSMTLRCIAGIETPDEGRIVLNGRVLFDSAKKINLKPRQRRVGYLFQSYALFPNMTVAQNIACGAAGTREGKQQQVAQLAARFELQGLEKRYPAQLSGGQQQRVALARMLAAKPEVLLLDEPFSALDAHLKERMQVDMLALLGSYGGDALLVTHNRDEAYKLCPRLLVLDDGRRLAEGDTRALFKAPGSLGVARLTGCKNLVEATREDESTVEIPSWGVRLRVNAPLPGGLTHIGVRAHDFAPAQSAGAPNAIPVQQVQSIEDPFEWNILLRPTAGRQGTEIWWKVPKTGAAPEIPRWLMVPPDAILPLTP